MSVARPCDLRPGAHPHKGKTFIVINGQLRIDFRDGSVALQAGVVFVVPKGRAFLEPALRPLGVASTYSPRGPWEWPLFSAQRTPGADVQRPFRIAAPPCG